VGSILKKSPVLENLHDFTEAVRDGVKPSGGRDLHVEVLQGVHDWHTFFAPLGLNISGIVTTKWEPDACHSWRLVRRSEINMYTNSQTWSIEVPKEGPAHGRRA